MSITTTTTATATKSDTEEKPCMRHGRRRGIYIGVVFRGIAHVAPSLGIEARLRIQELTAVRAVPDTFAPLHNNTVR